MITTTTWQHNFTNYTCLNDINQSDRQYLKILQPIAAKRIRLQLNNLFDEIPLEVTSLKIFSEPGHQKSVTMNDNDSFQIEPHLKVWSDWIDLTVPAGSFLNIELISPNQAIHTAGLTISNALVKTAVTDPKIAKYFFGISGIQVETKESFKRLAFFGDSLTNQGNFSAPLAVDLENNFQVMTANFGISGNRLLRPGHSTSKWSDSFGEAGLSRFDHMLVEYRPDIIIFMEGINDLFHPGTGSPMSELPSAKAIIQAIYQLKAKCRQFNITFVPMTITPASNNSGWSAQKEALRLTVNQAILQLPHVIDVASLVDENGGLKPEYDCGDHLHLSQIGGQVVARHIKEQLIRKKMI
ncbi:GDSL family lipase [Companilactobacillus mindensis DSM 14500]|uniref:GDSL family lipase n=1 Tax=Companilactobacillus mindensis DSM 14500 TaxID=1423770 RepID=A0A0R1QJ99_9LACO|nr:GDSL-type esterase/lipase family protein [Companilactobacillus mindensis]KRL44902.1 GDSL family lipase [Companilactobacillus mindensis DSM 14500]GEO79228.1 hypothetical protein LMI01_15590 [Companilactobacillus mindensis]